MKNLKNKNLLLGGIAIFFILLGYINYIYTNGEEINIALDRQDDMNIGDVELVSANAVSDNNIVNSQIVPNDDNINEVKIETSGSIDKNQDELEIDNYFRETLLVRDKMYSEVIETYQKLIDNKETPQDQKAIASQEIGNLTKEKNSITLTENLIKNKGYKDVIVLINNKKANVIVRAVKLEKEDISKIQNIIERELNIEVKNINITTK